jgi:ankyrin repeat protein
MLLKNGFDVNAVTPVGSALHEATLCGKVEVAKILLSEGIDTSLTDCNKRTVMDVVQELNTSVTREIGSLIRGKRSRRTRINIFFSNPRVLQKFIID